MRLVALRDPPQHGGRWQCSACGAVVTVTSSGTVVLVADSPVLDWAVPHCLRCAERLEAVVSS